MAKKKKTVEDPDSILIKRHGNRRLYNTETRSYVNLEQLAEIVREGNDIRVVDSKTDEDVTKAVLIQVILEEEKKDSSVLPTEFLFQVLRSQEGSMQDFFRNHLSASFEAYMKTKEEFDNRFRSILEMAVSAPHMMEKLIPGAEVMREVFTGTGDKDKDKE